MTGGALMILRQCLEETPGKDFAANENQYKMIIEARNMVAYINREARRASI